MDFEKIVDESLRRYSFFCNNGVYGLFSSRESIKEQLINKFKGDGYDSIKVSNLIEICDQEVFSSINSQKLVYSWFIEENKLNLKKKIMNTALQST
jgi:hypothetical protein